MGVEPASGRALVCVCVHPHFQTLISLRPAADRNQISSRASLGWGIVCKNFGPDRIRTLVSMATDSSHRVIMENIL